MLRCFPSRKSSLWHDFDGQLSSDLACPDDKKTKTKRPRDLHNLRLGVFFIPACTNLESALTNAQHHPPFRERVRRASVRLNLPCQRARQPMLFMLVIVPHVGWSSSTIRPEFTMPHMAPSPRHGGTLHVRHCHQRTSLCLRMMEVDDNEEETLAGFGLQSLFRTSLFVTLWWALWSLYDFYLSPFSPWPEFIILAAAAAYSVREDLATSSRADDVTIPAASSSKPKSQSGMSVVWPCTSDGCSAEDLYEPAGTAAPSKTDVGATKAKP